jgi:homoserine O-acetyltransferase
MVATFACAGGAQLRLGGPFPDGIAAMSLASCPESISCNSTPAGHGANGVARAAVPALRGEIAVPLALRHSGTRIVALRYELLGEAALSAVFVAGGISAHRHAGSSEAFADVGWWEAQVGPGRALDPTRHRIVSFDWLGGDGSLDAVIDPADQADAIAAVLDALRIERLEAFVGCSYGAMVGLQFAARHGTRLGHLVAVSGAHRAHPFSSAWRALQRRAVALGALQCDESHGLALARQLAILSYRTPEEFDERFDAAQVVDGRVRVAAENYLDHCGTQYTARTLPVAFQRLSESIDLQRVEPESIRVPATVVAIEGDRLVPVADSIALAERLGARARLQRLSSLYGHDAFLKEEAAIAAVLTQALQEAATSIPSTSSPTAIEAAA